MNTSTRDIMSMLQQAQAGASSRPGPARPSPYDPKRKEAMEHVKRQLASDGQVASNGAPRGSQVLPSAPGSSSVYVIPQPNDDLPTPIKGEEIVRYAKRNQNASAANADIISFESDILVYAVHGGAVRAIRLADNARSLFTEHKASIVSLTISPCVEETEDGMELFVGSVDEVGQAIVWNISEEDSGLATEDVWSLLPLDEDEDEDSGEEEKATAVLWHPLYQEMFLLQRESCVETYRWSEEEGTYALSSSFDTMKGNVTSSKWSSDGKQIAIVSDSNFCRVWNVTSGKCLLEFDCSATKTDGIGSIHFCGSSLLVSSLDHSALSLYSTRTKKLESMLSLQSGENKVNHGKPASFNMESSTSNGVYIMCPFATEKPTFNTSDYGLLAVRVKVAASGSYFDYVSCSLVGNHIQSFAVGDISNDAADCFCITSFGVKKLDVPLHVELSTSTPVGRAPTPALPEVSSSASQSVFNMDRLESVGSMLSPMSFSSQTQPEKQPEKPKEKAKAEKPIKILKRPDSAASKDTKKEEPVSETSVETPKSSTETKLLAKLDKLFEKHHQKLYRSLEKERKEKERAEAARMQNVLVAVNDIISASTSKHVGHSMNRALQTQLVPAIQHEMTSAVAKVAGAMGKAIAPLIQDAVGKAMATSLPHTLKEPIAASFATSFEKVLIPSFEASFKTMFQQVESHMATHMKQREDLLLEQLKAQNQVIASLKESLGAGGPHEATAQVQNPRVRIQGFLDKEMYNDAFGTALNEGDLDLVAWLCTKCDETKWAIIPQLTSPVLLALIQQLSIEVDQDTELKLEWLSSATVNISRDDPTITAHVPRVLSHVAANISKKLPSLPPKQAHSASVILHLMKGYGSASK